MVNRRELLTALGVSASAVLAGCQETQGSEEEEEPEKEEDDEEEVVEEEEDLPPVEDTYFSVIDLIDISKDTLTIEAHADISSDLVVHVYENTFDPDTPGEWQYRTLGVNRHSESYPVFNESFTEWMTPNRSAHIRPELILDETETHQATMDFSEPEFTEEILVDTENEIQGVSTYRLEIPLEQEPPMYETCIYTFAIDFTHYDEHSEFDGEVVSRTPHIIRVDDDEFIYPHWRDEDDELVEYPHWREYDIHDMYWNEHVDSSSNTVKRRVMRTSNYGIYSEKYDEIAESITDLYYDHSTGEREYWHYKSDSGAIARIPTDHREGFLDNNSFVQLPWSITYEFDQSVLDDAIREANSLTNGDDTHDIWAMVNESSVVNHHVIQDIARQLGDVCDQLNATEPTEKLRVVADFIQYFGYGEHKNAFDGTNFENNRADTYHPVDLLATGYGDCKDFTILAYGILQQDPFNFDVSVAHIEDVPFTDVRHVSVGVAMDDVEIDDHEEDKVTRMYPHARRPGLFTDQGKEYMYIETSYPDAVGLVATDVYREPLEVEAFRDFAEEWL